MFGDCFHQCSSIPHIVTQKYIQSLFFVSPFKCTYLSGDGSSLIARKTGHKETPDDEYRGAPSVLKMKLIFDLL